MKSVLVKKCHINKSSPDSPLRFKIQLPQKKFTKESGDSEKENTKKFSRIETSEQDTSSLKPCPNYPDITAITVTSPKGYERKLRIKKSQLFNPNPTCISFKSEFWLPKLSSEELRYFALETATNSDYNEHQFQSYAQKIEYDDFFEAISVLEIKWKVTGGFLHASKVLNESWLAVFRDRIIQVGESGWVEEINVSEIAYILIDKDYLALDVVPFKAEGVRPENIDLIILTGDANKTESILTSILFASSHNKPYEESILLKSISCSKFPFFKRLEKQINSSKDMLILFCLAQVETIPSEMCITDDIMMQYGCEKYQPVNIHLKGKCLKIIPTYTPLLIDQTQSFEVNTYQITAINRKELPRPHTLLITWNSKFIHLSASNLYTIDELFGRLRRHKDAAKILSKQTVFVLLTDSTLYLFSTMGDNELLFEIPLINLILMGKHNSTSIIITNGTVEADETSCDATNSCSWKITFYTENHCEQFLNHLKSV